MISVYFHAAVQIFFDYSNYSNAFYCDVYPYSNPEISIRQDLQSSDY